MQSTIPYMRCKALQDGRPSSYPRLGRFTTYTFGLLPASSLRGNILGVESSITGSATAVNSAGA